MDLLINTKHSLNQTISLKGKTSTVFPAARLPFPLFSLDCHPDNMRKHRRARPSGPRRLKKFFTSLFEDKNTPQVLHIKTRYARAFHCQTFQDRYPRLSPYPGCG
jgi:hypothetical protein